MSNNVDFAELFAPEAEEFVGSLLSDRQVTQHNYGRALAMVSQIKGSFTNDLPAKGFLQAMINAGYPRATAAQVAQLAGLSGFGDSQSILMGLE